MKRKKSPIPFSIVHPTNFWFSFHSDNTVFSNLVEEFTVFFDVYSKVVVSEVKLGLKK